MAFKTVYLSTDLMSISKKAVPELKPDELHSLSVDQATVTKSWSGDFRVLRQESEVKSSLM